MAGGEGTRLRPMTANQPKPMLPVVNRPIMEHVLRLLRKHGLTETVVTVQFLASMVRNYFGDGEDFGMNLQYATEETPLGTAGSVKNAEDALRDEPFLVISGDALTDIDLSDLIRFHKDNQALVTVALARVPDPLEFGIVIVDDDGRIQRFLEKPTWGQVFSDTVNTGIYVMQPEVLAEVPAGEVVDWSADVFPKLLEAGAPLYGWIADGYWEDVGTHEAYLRAQADALSGRVNVEIDGFEVSPGVWIAEGAEVDPEAVLHGPLVHRRLRQDRGGRPAARVHRRGQQRDGQGGRVPPPRRGAQQRLRRPRRHPARLRGRQEHRRDGAGADRGRRRRRGRVRDRARGCYLSAGVKVYPFKTIEAGAVVNTSVIWESRGQRTLFGTRGVSGLVNVEITPELCVRLASAYATTLKKGSIGHHVARRLPRGRGRSKRAVQSALNAARDQRRSTWRRSRCRWPGSRPRGSDYSGGIALRTTPGDTAVDRHHLPRRATARTCPSRRSASSSGSSPGRSSGARSLARSPS